jgi:DAK2 domain fusion protein YloV
MGPQPYVEDASADVVRRWCSAARSALGAAREEIDTLNVYPVPDGDTGTNLYVTMDAAAAAVEALPGDADLGATLRALARGALLGARGNSGIILSQLLRGIGEVLADPPVHRPETRIERRPVDGSLLAAALDRAVKLAYAAVARPVEGTMLSVAAAAARAADSGRTTDLPGVAAAAAAGAWSALERTPDQLDVLRLAGVVDAGGRGLCELLQALAYVVSVDGERPAAAGAAASLPLLPGQPPDRARDTEPDTAPDRAQDRTHDAGAAGAVFEVMYLLDAGDARVAELREVLDALGDSLVVVGGDGLWNVHVHVEDAGAAVEAGIRAGRPHRIRVTQLTRSRDPAARGGSCPAEATQAAGAGRRAVVGVAAGPGLAGLLAAAGAEVVSGGPGQRASTAEVLAAIRRTGAREVVVLPNDAGSVASAEAAATAARAVGLRVAVVPTRASVQALAAMAVHEPQRRFDDDVVRMTAAAGHARHGGVTVAERDAVTMAGVCRAGDVLGIVDGDFAVVGVDLAATACVVLDRLLTGGGELVTLLVGAEGDEELARAVADHLRRTRPEVETVVLPGGQPRYPLLVGVE